MSANRDSRNDGDGQVHRMQPMPFGDELRDGRSRFRMWAPAQPALTLVIEGRSPILWSSGRLPSG
jgi:hypothetical protein